jgi:MuDR family transposase
MVALKDTFLTIQEARNAINCHVLDEGESYKVHKSDRQRYIIVCKDSTCKFKIWASLLKKKGVEITIMVPYSCSPAVHYKNKQSSAKWFLKDHHCPSVINDKDITLA